MVIENVSGCFSGKNRIEDGNLPAGAVPQQKTPNHLDGSSFHDNSAEMPRMRP
jgi:hypothetical protein